MEQKQFHSMLFLIVWSLSSIAGAVLISDEFDSERVITFGFILIPILAIFVFSYFEDPRFWLKYHKGFHFLLIGLGLCFLWGNLLLLNCLAKQPVVIGKVYRNDTTDRAMIGAYKKGVLGHLYRFRF